MSKADNPVESTPGSGGDFLWTQDLWRRLRDKRHKTEYAPLLPTSVGVGKPVDKNLEFAVAVCTRKFCDSSLIGLGHHHG